jgi:hypothetical protein
MFAKNLELLLFTLCEKSDASPDAPAEFTERLGALRRSSKLPQGRDKRDRVLVGHEIVAAIFGLVPARPGWAGHAAIILAGLRPVGGTTASFLNTATLGESVERILTDAGARKCVIKLSLSVAEASVNSSGYATLLYEVAGAQRSTFYVRKEAMYLLRPGAEREFDPDQRYSPASREMVFSRVFFDRVARGIDDAKRFPIQPAGDGSEYDSEEEQHARFRRLDARPNSRFLNIGVDNQVTRPSQETLVKFDQYHLVLMPKTNDHVQSIHVDLIANHLSLDAAKTVINRFLSVMTWCDDQFAIAQEGWSGNPVPVAVRKRNLAFTTTHHWIFDRQIPQSQEAKRALALYREARNAEQNFMVSYAVLNFFKVIEIRNGSTGDVKNWFRDNFEVIRSDPANSDSFSRFAAICGNERPSEYIYRSCRIAVAHANKHSKSDPDDASELTRLHLAADVLRVLARHFIATQFGISDVLYSGD